MLYIKKNIIENIFKTIQENYENLEIIYPTNEFNYKLNGNDEK